jgi:hypothetical protein
LGWRSGWSCRAPILKVWSPEFKPQSREKKTATAYWKAQFVECHKDGKYPSSLILTDILSDIRK